MVEQFEEVYHSRKCLKAREYNRKFRNIPFDMTNEEGNEQDRCCRDESSEIGEDKKRQNTQRRHL